MWQKEKKQHCINKRKCFFIFLLEKMCFQMMKIIFAKNFQLRKMKKQKR